MSPAYEELLRDVARRTLKFDPLTSAELAVIVTEFPDVIAEAVAERTELFVEALQANAPVSVAGVFVMLLRQRCEAYIALDVRVMRETIEAEDRNEDEYTHREFA